jgi:hypothetical protein
MNITRQLDIEINKKLDESLYDYSYKLSYLLIKLKEKIPESYHKFLDNKKLCKDIIYKNSDLTKIKQNIKNIIENGSNRSNYENSSSRHYNNNEINYKDKRYSPYKTPNKPIKHYNQISKPDHEKEVLNFLENSIEEGEILE